jgi:hypothetical protein
MGKPVGYFCMTDDGKFLTDEEICELFNIKGTADADRNAVQAIADVRRLEERIRQKNWMYNGSKT